METKLKVALRELEDAAMATLQTFYSWLVGLSEVERLFGMSMFVVLFIIITLRQPDSARLTRARNNLGPQFIMAAVVVGIFTYGVGWVLDSVEG